MVTHDDLVTTTTEGVSAAVPEIADALRDAESTRVAIAPPTATHPGLTIDDAYAIQRANMRRRVAAGERLVGHKVGLTSLAMQKQLGVDQPDFGVITDTMVVPHGAEFVVGELVAPRVEPEFAFLIGRDLPPSPSLEELTAAVEGVGLAIEIIDSRVADWKITLIDTVADNASSARIVHGDFATALPSLLSSLPSTIITLTRDGEEVGSGPGAAVLGDPLVALHWLATAIGAYGESFSRGDIVLAGAVTGAVPLTAGSEWTVTAPGFEPVAFRSI